MIELTCASCGDKVKAQGFLAAAQQSCPRCGQLVMGPLAAGSRKARPMIFDGQPPAPSFGRSGGSAGLWLGMLVGVGAGIALVVAMAHGGRIIPQEVQGAVLGALMGSLFAPVIAIASFLPMLILPFSLEGIFGDSIWSRLARANTERRLGPLFIPFLILLVLPMTVCGFGGSKMSSIDTPMVVLAGMGAVMLGLLFGGICGTILDHRRGPV